MRLILSSMFVLLFTVFSLGSEMPPMPPMMGSSSKSIKPNNDFQNKMSDIKECSSLPPMIIFLPPPMEKDLISCRNKFYKPTVANAEKALSKMIDKKVSVSKISLAEGFRELYKIEYSYKKFILTSKKTSYCNAKLTKCLD